VNDAYAHSIISDARLEVFTVVKIQVAVCHIITPCHDVVGYQCCRGPCCLHFLGLFRKLFCVCVNRFNIPLFM